MKHYYTARVVEIHEEWGLTLVSKNICKQSKVNFFTIENVKNQDTNTLLRGFFILKYHLSAPNKLRNIRQGSHIEFLSKDVQEGVITIDEIVVITDVRNDI